MSESLHASSKTTKDYSRNLEQKVAERTRKLEKVNTQLKIRAYGDMLVSFFSR